ncbi:hypothetical protein [Ruegeria sp. HKCCA5763]|uniref:hypothetical protein n=1 Tax=Ruegeria sp. HKCCA5763 TaxID=2682987 RepID=UPI00148A00BC|nr:hypothetical protein [Ruegeria sp. HKCCA5763]
MQQDREHPFAIKPRKVWITSVWGAFENNAATLFNQPGSARTACKETSPDDVIFSLCTLGEPTVEEDRGRVLNAMLPAQRETSTAEFSFMSDEDKERWKSAMLSHTAYYIDSRPIAKNLVPGWNWAQEVNTMAMQSRLVDLTDTPMADALLSELHKNGRPISVATSPQSSHFQRETAKKVGFTGPRPTDNVSVPKREMSLSSFTYLARLGNTDVYQLGKSNDVVHRVNSFNHHRVPGEPEWEVLHKVEFLGPNAEIEAYNHEQRLLRRFDNYRTAQNKEILVGVRQVGDLLVALQSPSTPTKVG